MEKFNVEQETENIIKFIKDYYKKNKLGGSCYWYKRRQR